MANTDIVDDCKKYLGIAPYNNFTNICVGDPYFHRALCDKYGAYEVNQTILDLRARYHI